MVHHNSVGIILLNAVLFYSSGHYLHVCLHGLNTSQKMALQFLLVLNYLTRKLLCQNGHMHLVVWPEFPQLLKYYFVIEIQ